MPRRLAAASLALVATATFARAQTPAQADSAARAATRAGTLPLITTRTLSFNTTEGTWISLDVAPDGKTIAFELLGDLYALPIAGGTATRLTSGPGYDTQPRYSPDGKSLVFVSDRNGSENVWIANADGTAPRILSKGERQNFVSPTWTPDGQYVMVTKDGQLWLYHRDGGTGVQVTGVRPPGAPAPGTPQPPALLGAAFGGNARYVWVTARRNPQGDFGSATVTDPAAARDEKALAVQSSARLIGLYQVAMYDRELGRTSVRTTESDGAFRPVPSPDGRWLVYATRTDAREGLKLLDLTTGESRWLVMDVQRDASQGGADRDVYPGSAFTPDSRALVTAFGGKIWRVDVPSGAVTPIPFSATIEQRLAPLARFDYPIDDTTLVVSQIRGARPSPDGRRVAFTALDRLYVADLPPGRGGAGRPANTPPTFATIDAARRLTSAEVVEHAPVWSPDGSWIAYVTWNDSTGGDIWRVRADGSRPPERLTRRSAFYDKLSWSRDGARLVAVRGSRQHRTRMLEDFGSLGLTAELEIVWLPATGGDLRSVSWLGNGETQQGRGVPHFGPDSTRIYVWTGRTDGLVSMRLDGTDRRTVVRVTGLPAPAGPGAPQAPDEVVISPDGSRAIVRSDRNVFMIAVPPVGGTAPTVAVTAASSVPTARLTRVGGDFVGWSHDARTAFFSIGRSYFQYDVALADSLVRDSVSRAEPNAAAPQPPRPDSARGDSARGAAATAAPTPGTPSRPAYEPYRADVRLVMRKDRPTGVVALRGARIITMKGDEVVADGDVVVRDNRIVAVGPKGSVTIPDGARTIDVAGKTIMPGLVDIHAHTWVAWGVHREQVSQFLAQLAYGVTTQRDPQTSSEDIVTYADLMEVGRLIGPRLYSTGPGIFASDNIKSLDEARDVVRRYADHFNTKTIKQYLAGDRKVRQWVITAARELGLTTTTEGGADFVMNLTLMQDGYAGLEHSLPISPLFRDVAQLHAFSGLTYTPTFIVAYGGPPGFGQYLTSYDVEKDPKLRRFTPHDELDKWKDVNWTRGDLYVHKLHAQQLPKLVEAGGRIGLGSHGELQGLGTHWEMWMMASGGLAPHAMLRAATLGGAEAIGLARDIGSIEPGKLADLLVLDRNPLDDITNSNSLRHVMKNGRLYDAATLDEIWPRQRPLPAMWWTREESVPPPR